MSELADKIALECRYHVLSDCVTLKSGSFKKVLDELRTLEAENARLRKAVEDAPIGDQCDGMQCIRIFEEWQAKALGDHNGTT